MTIYSSKWTPSQVITKKNSRWKWKKISIQATVQGKAKPDKGQKQGLKDLKGQIQGQLQQVLLQVGRAEQVAWRGIWLGIAAAPQSRSASTSVSLPATHAFRFCVIHAFCWSFVFSPFLQCESADVSSECWLNWKIFCIVCTRWIFPFRSSGNEFFCAPCVRLQI